MKVWDCYAGGKRIKGNYPFEVRDKYTGEILGVVYAAGKEEILLAVEMAKENFQRFRNLPSYIKHLECTFIAAELEKQKEEFARNIAQESGKPIRYARAEVERAVQVFVVAAEEAKRLPKEYISLDWTAGGKNREGMVKWFPAGIVAGISPFNFPLNLAVHKIAPAFASACPVLLKPSSLTPTTVLMLAEIIDRTEHLKNLLFILPSNRSNGNILVEHPDVQVLSFTGSPEVGWQMKERAGKKKVVLELGGNAAVVVDKDADVQKIMPGCVYGAFAYSGQICIHAQRFIVHEQIYNVFREVFVEQTRKLNPGNPLDEHTDISVMIDEHNLKRVEEWIAEAVQKKARVLCGNNKKNNILLPVILEDVPPDCKVYSEEVFGPVVTLEAFCSDEEAVQKVNASRFGLQCGVFTNRIDFLRYCFENIDVGGLIHNQVPTVRYDHMPYGGIKESGLGREGIRYAIRDYMEPRILVW